MIKLDDIKLIDDEWKKIYDLADLEKTESFFVKMINDYRYLQSVVFRASHNFKDIADKYYLGMIHTINKYFGMVVQVYDIRKPLGYYSINSNNYESITAFYLDVLKYIVNYKQNWYIDYKENKL